MNQIKRVIIYTDGACSGNPGPGGWAALLKYGEHVKTTSGGEKRTTSNRMEITAAIEALKLLKEPCEVEIFSDSAYLVDAHNLGWLAKWQRTNWTRNKGQDQVLNVDLWQALLNEEKRHKVTWHKVSGHSGVEENEICDKLAVKQSLYFKQLEN